MSSSVLKLKELVSSEAYLDKTLAYLPLEDGLHPALYIYEKSLAFLMMRHPDLKPVNFMDFWKVLTGVTAQDILDIETYFIQTPLLLHQQAHFEARRSLLPLYRRIEIGMASWVDRVTSEYLVQYADSSSIQLIDFVDAYLDEVFRQIIAREMGLSPDALPKLPGKIFQFLTRLDIILDYETKVNNLRSFLEAHLPAIGGASIQELWGLISIAIMGTDTLSGALMYFIANHDESLTIDTLFEKSRPISLVSREATAPIELNNLKLSKGQRVYISTQLLNDGHQLEAIPFGFGAHLCPGKKMSFILLDAFINSWQANPHLHARFSKVKFLRDSVLKAKEVK